MDKTIKSGMAVVGAFLTYVITKYQSTAIALLFIVFCMIIEQISWTLIIRQIKADNKNLQGKKKVFKNPLHSKKIDVWLFIAVVMVIEIVTCLMTGVNCNLLVTCATMLYFGFVEISSFAVNQSFRNNSKMLKILQKLANICIKAFDIVIDTVIDHADDAVSEDTIKKIVEKAINDKLN